MPKKLILRFELHNPGEHVIEMPADAVPLSVAVKPDQTIISLWVMCAHPIQRKEVHRTFAVLATGSAFESSGLDFIGTVIIPSRAMDTVWHVFERSAP